MQQRRDELALEAAREGGKPLVDSRVEVDRAIDGLRTCVELLRTQVGRGIPMDINLASAGRIAFTQHEPIGVVLAFSAFNHPVNLIVHQVCPAVAAGAPFIVKPAEATPLSCMRVISILREAGLPEEWGQALLTSDRDVAGKLVSDPRVAFFTFIGSGPVGWMLRSRLAPGAMSVGDSIPITRFDGEYNGYTVCIEKKEVTTFIGTNDQQITFFLDWDSQIIDEEQTFVLQRGVGLSFFKVAFHFSEYLVGAIIDGVVYGDTNVVSVEKAEDETPRHFSLSQNYPNPFNPSTTIRFDLPKATFVTLKVYNLLGEELETLLQEYRLAGFHKIHWTAEGLSSGHYFYRLQTGEFIDTKKFILNK